MIRKTISRSTFQEHLITLIKDEMAIEAIKDDGIYSTFEFSDHYLKDSGILKVNLYYCKFDGDDCSMPIHTKISYKCCPELKNTWLTLPRISPEMLQNATDRIKMDMAKKYNAIWSTIRVHPSYDYFDVSYEKAYVDNGKVATLKWKPVVEPMTAQEMEIENTKRTLQRLRENSYYGLYPSVPAYAFDEKAKEDLKASLKTWKTNAEAIEKEGRWKTWEPALKYAEADVKATKETFEFMNGRYLRFDKEEKEKKDMNVTLMVVPEGMNKDFVNKVKANYQSNTSRLFVASTDIDYSCEHEPIKTKYDLFEKWVKTGKVDIVYFMLGFEKDPDVRAFESFVRGITEAGAPGKVDVRVAYQRDDILNDANSLRTLYFDEADAKEDLENAGNKVVKEAKTMQDIYGLDDEGLEAIKYSKGRIEISEGLIMDKIMDAAFALDSDEDAKPAKKGGKK